MTNDNVLISALIEARYGQKIAEVGQDIQAFVLIDQEMTQKPSVSKGGPVPRSCADISTEREI